jgi:hypothetical protein
MEAADQHCSSNNCGRAFPRAVKRCPYCGALQNPVEGVDPNQVRPVEQIDSTVAGGVGFAGPSPSGQDSEKHDSASPDPEPNQTTTKLPPDPPNLKWQKWAIGSVVAAVVIFFVCVQFGSESVVKVEALPNSWTSVKLSDFPAGTRIVFSAPGAFRVRTATTPPVLVNGEAGDADLSGLPRDGVEIRSATGGTLDVVVRKGA